MSFCFSIVMIYCNNYRTDSIGCLAALGTHIPIVMDVSIVHSGGT